MKYLKVFIGFADDMEQLSDVEVGRLFRAMLQYAGSGTAPDLKGNERFLWPNAKRNIDNARQICDDLSAARSDAGKKGAEKRWQSDGKNSKCHFANGKNSYMKEKEKEKENVSSLRSETNTPHSPPKVETVYSEDADLNDALNAFVAFRKSAKKPMTPHAVDLLAKKLDTLAASNTEKIAIIEQSIVNGWTGVYPLKDGGQASGNVFLDIAREEGIL